MIRRRFVLALAFVLAWSACGVMRARASTFVLRTGRDTISVEQFTNTADHATGEILFRVAGLRMRYTIDFAGGSAFRRLEASVWKAADSATAAPIQHATFTQDGDSIVVVSSTGSPQHIAAPAGVIPYVNPSMALVERMVQRARQVPDSLVALPVLLTAGGQIVTATVARIAEDSASVDLAGVRILVHVTDGRVTGGRVPDQGLTLVRSEEPTGDAMRVARVDYTAPPGAPYTAEAVQVPTRGGFALAGTLTRPVSVSGRVPCVVTITGSGAQDRDETLVLVSGYRPFRQIAEECARAGIAVLRLDDRGFGESGGTFAGATTEDFADDVRAALTWLRARTDIDAQRLALLGHSEGGLVAPMIAATDSTLRGIILMAAPAWTGERIIAYQNEWALDHAAAPLSGAARDSALRASRAGLDSLVARDAWARFFLSYDPLPTARRVRVPVLILQGATDRQVPAEEAGELAAAIRAGGNDDVTVRVLPDVDHLFLADPSGDPRGYVSLPDRAIRPQVLHIITDWLRVALRAPRERAHRRR